MSILDMDKPQDQALLRNYIVRNKRRWAAMTDEKKAAIVSDLDAARHVARQILDGSPDAETTMYAIGAIASIAKTMAVIEGQNQKDEIADRELEKADKVQVHEHRHYVVKPPRLLGEG